MHRSSERPSPQMLEAKARGAKVMAVLQLKRGHAGVTARRVNITTVAETIPPSPCGLLKSRPGE